MSIMSLSCGLSSHVTTKCLAHNMRSKRLALCFTWKRVNCGGVYLVHLVDLVVLSTQPLLVYLAGDV